MKWTQLWILIQPLLRWIYQIAKIEVPAEMPRENETCGCDKDHSVGIVTVGRAVYPFLLSSLVCFVNIKRGEDYGHEGWGIAHLPSA